METEDADGFSSRHPGASYLLDPGHLHDSLFYPPWNPDSKKLGPEEWKRGPVESGEKDVSHLVTPCLCLRISAGIPLPFCLRRRPPPYPFCGGHVCRRKPLCEFLRLSHARSQGGEFSARWSLAHF